VEILEKLDSRNNASHHDLKLHLIEECIYGVDIQTIAAQISKLRFFISLIVEQEVMDISKPEENYGVLTLPNLETKFVAANTLIGMKKKKEGDFVNSLFTDPRIDETKHQLMEVRKEHFYAKSAYKKKELRDKDASLRAQLSKLLQDNNEFAPEEAIQFSQWNPYDQNASSPFFDPEWMFGLSKENGGLNSTDGGYFDIVLANPPYVEAKKLKHISNQLKSYSVYAGTADLSSYFFEKGIELCKPKGTLCYINTNKFFNTGYGKPLRNFLLKYQIDSLINFEQVKVFEKVLAELGKYEIDNFGGWLYRIAQNACISQIRAQKQFVAEEYLVYVPADVEPDTRQFWEKEQQHERLQLALEQLKPDQKICVSLFFLQKMSYQQIAEMHQYDIKEVKSYIQNGKRNLRLIMEQMEQAENVRK